MFRERYFHICQHGSSNPKHLRVLQGLKNIETLFSGGGNEGTDDGENFCALQCPETARDFLPDFHHPQVAFGQVVGERHIGIMPEPQHIFPELLQAQCEIMTLAFCPGFFTIFPWQRWQAFMICDGFSQGLVIQEQDPAACLFGEYFCLDPRICALFAASL